jgi:hypothetical protein
MAFFWKKYSLVYLYLWVEMDTDPDPAQRCRSARSGSISILRMCRLEGWNCWHVQVEDLGFTKLLRMRRLKLLAHASLRSLIHYNILLAKVGILCHT